jgi:hypothetical protein
MLTVVSAEAKLDRRTLEEGLREIKRKRLEASARKDAPTESDSASSSAPAPAVAPSAP